MDADVNGRPGPVPESGTAAEHLREQLGLTGTKVACGSGACGACTVLVEGSPTASCLLPADRLAGRTVTTVEGLGGEHPVQRAFVAHDAMQCGYCTPGFSWSRPPPSPTVGAVSTATVAPAGPRSPRRSAATCAAAASTRGSVAAVRAACTGKHDTETEGAPPRSDAPEKVTGRALFTADLGGTRAWEGVIVRSSRPHDRVVEVSAEHTRTEPGGGDETPVIVPLPVPDGVVRYVGRPWRRWPHPPPPRPARRAAEQVQVDYVSLPPVVGTEQARRPETSGLYPKAEERGQAPSYGEAPTPPAPWRGNVRGSGVVSRRGPRPWTACAGPAAGTIRCWWPRSTPPPPERTPPWSRTLPWVTNRVPRVRRCVPPLA